jgi:hypothetical protein
MNPPAKPRKMSTDDAVRVVRKVLKAHTGTATQLAFLSICKERTRLRKKCRNQLPFDLSAAAHEERKIMKTINWKTATDAEKNACFAEQVAQIPCEIWKSRRGNTGIIAKDDGRGLPDYLHSGDAVLPWLEKCYTETAYASASHYTDSSGPPQWQVRAFCGNLTCFGDAPTFAEAAMIALLRAKGVEVIT